MTLTDKLKDVASKAGERRKTWVKKARAWR
jgi:hypothetical protein